MIYKYTVILYQNVIITRILYILKKGHEIFGINANKNVECVHMNLVCLGRNGYSGLSDRQFIPRSQIMSIDLY